MERRQEIYGQIEIPEDYWVCSHDVEWVCEEL